MITFGIAEDEQVERIALERFITRNFSEADVCWTAENGLKALENARHTPVDVLIVDINMPEMDGLSLCEVLSQEEYSGLLVINTAYDRFSYAQRAIHYGVSDYILKPSSNDELRERISNCIQRVKAQKQQRADLREQLERAHSLLQYSEAHLLGRMLQGEDISEQLRDFGWPEEHMQTSFMMLSTMAGTMEWENQLRALITARYGRHIFYAVCKVQEGFLLMLQPRYIYPNAQWTATVSCIGTVLAHELSSVSGVRISGACSSSAAMHQAYLELLEASERPILEAIQERCSLLPIEECERLVNGIRRRLYDQKPMGIRPLFKTFWTRYKEEANELLWELIALYVAASYPNCSGMRANIAWEQVLFTDRAPDNALFDEWFAQIQMFSQEEESARTSLEYVLEIMHAEFASNLTQSEMAARLGMTPSYFSRYFKQKTGRRFTEVMTDIRMQHALQLLIGDPQLTIEQLTERCGFYSKTYFCEVFKRCVGKTVGQYVKEDLHSNACEDLP